MADRPRFLLVRVTLAPRYGLQAVLRGTRHSDDFGALANLVVCDRFEAVRLLSRVQGNDRGTANQHPYFGYMLRKIISGLTC